MCAHTYTCKYICKIQKKFLTWNLEVLCEESLNREDKSQNKIQMNISNIKANIKQSSWNTKALNYLNKIEVLEACDDSGGGVESMCFLKEIVKMGCGEQVSKKISFEGGYRYYVM